MAPQPRQQAAAPATSSSTPAPGSFQLPIAYRLFFLFIEPVSALVGAYYAHLDQRAYLELTDASSSPTLTGAADDGAIPRGTAIVLSQLANLYLFFALNEALVLRSTGDLRVWRTVLALLLLADFGHLWTVRPLGWAVYWRAAGWNAIDWGNVPFVYLGASMRIAFLSGVGLGGGGTSPAAAPGGGKPGRAVEGSGKKTT
jgi:hypothetical protein